MTYLSIVTTTDPAARQLPILLEALSSLALHQAQNYEVIIVDDLNQWAFEAPPAQNAMPSLTIKAISPQQHQGQLKAIQQGLAYATSPLVLTIDPDLHPCVPEIPDMVMMINETTMAVHAVRSTRTDIGLFRQTASGIVNFFTRQITGLEVKDIGCPVTLFRRELLNMLPPSSPGKQPNIRLRAYLMLGERLSFYNLKAGSSNNVSSHYNFLRLAGTSWRLLRDAIWIRFRYSSKNT